MSFASKIDENQKVALKCLSIGAYNAGINRVYYCAFQKAKYYLCEKCFDYKAFLAEIGKQEEKEYSHGTIQHAIVTCLMKNGKRPADIYKLNAWDELYNNRIKAAYTEKTVKKIDLIVSLQYLETILSIIA